MGHVSIGLVCEHLRLRFCFHFYRYDLIHLPDFHTNIV